MSMDLVVSVRLDNTTAKALKRYSASENKKISVVCRDIITQYFNDTNTNTNQWRKDIEFQILNLKERVKELEPKSNLDQLGL